MAVRLCCELSISEQAAVLWKRKSERCDEFHDASFIAVDYCNHISELSSVWYETDYALSNEILDDRADCFVVGMLYYAMAVEEDIESTFPISEELLFHLNDYLLPMLSRESGTRCIRIVAKPIGPSFKHGCHVGTGMSCGIDSLETLYRYYESCNLDSFRITDLAFFDVGADKGYVSRGNSWDKIDEALEPFDVAAQHKSNRAEQIAHSLNLGFVDVKSNLTKIYQGLFEESHLYRTASAALFLQGYFDRYYISSAGYALDDFAPSIQIDPAHYELTLIPSLCTGNLKFEIAGRALDRVQKFNEIKDYEIAQKYLNVCSDLIPCYRCTKDFRMIIIMDILGCEDKFKNIYPTDMNKKYRWKAYYWLLKNRSTDPYAEMLLQYVNSANCHIPFKSKSKYAIWKMLHTLRIR